MFIRHSKIVPFLLYRFNADKPAPLLRRWILPLHYHKLLSAPPPSRDTSLSRSLPRSYGTDPPASSICSRRLRGHARACPSSLHRAGARKSFAGAGRLETNLRPSAAARTSRPSRCPDKRALEYTRRRGTRLATPLLRFCCLLGQEARRKAALH